MLLNFIGFQAPVTPIMEGIIDLHNYIFVFLIGILVFVLVAFTYILIYYYVIPTYLFSLDIELDRKVNDVTFFSGKEEFYKSKGRIFSIFYRLFDFLVLFYQKLIIFIRMKLLLKNLNGDYTYYKLLALYQLRFEIIETRKIVHGTIIEIVWTILPSIILLFIAVPSFALLYSMDEIIDPKLTVKAIGYQWFWSYEYGQEYDDIMFNYFTDIYNYNYKYSRDALVYDSVLIPDTDLLPGYHRLLDVDHSLILPIETHIRLIITAADVLHSWAVPVLGIKLDAIPGRLSQIGLYIKREGVYYGQCSELCGVNHGFMPISLKAVSLDTFLNWYHSVEVVWNFEGSSVNLYNENYENLLRLESLIKNQKILNEYYDLAFSMKTNQACSYFINKLLSIDMTTESYNELKNEYNIYSNKYTECKDMMRNILYNEYKYVLENQSMSGIKKFKKLLYLNEADIDKKVLSDITRMLLLLETDIQEINQTTNQFILENRPQLHYKMLKRSAGDALELEFLRSGRLSAAGRKDPYTYEREYLAYERKILNPVFDEKPSYYDKLW